MLIEAIDAQVQDLDGLVTLLDDIERAIGPSDLDRFLGKSSTVELAGLMAWCGAELARMEGEMAGKGMSVSDYARHRGVSRRAVYDALAAGRIQKLPDGTIDATAADATWSLSARARVDAAPTPDPVQGRGPGARQSAFTGIATGAPASLQAALIQATIVEKTINARAKKLKLDKDEGALVPAESARLVVAYVGRLAQRKLLDIAANVTSKVVSEARAAQSIVDAEREVRRILDEQHRLVLEEIAREPPPCC